MKKLISTLCFASLLLACGQQESAASKARKAQSIDLTGNGPEGKPQGPAPTGTPKTENGPRKLSTYWPKVLELNCVEEASARENVFSLTSVAVITAQFVVKVKKDADVKACIEDLQEISSAFSVKLNETSGLLQVNGVYMYNDVGIGKKIEQPTVTVTPKPVTKPMIDPKKEGLEKLLAAIKALSCVQVAAIDSKEAGLGLTSMAPIYPKQKEEPKEDVKKDKIGVGVRDSANIAACMAEVSGLAINVKLNKITVELFSIEIML